VTVHKALKDAQRVGTLARNVADSASPPSAKSTRSKEMACGRRTKLRRFLELTADEDLAPLFRVACDDSMRRGEVCGLRGATVDFERARIEVRHQPARRPVASRTAASSFAERTKTDRGRRRIRPRSATVAALRTQRARSPAAAPDGRRVAGTSTTSSSRALTALRSILSRSPRCSTAG